MHSNSTINTPNTPNQLQSNIPPWLAPGGVILLVLVIMAAAVGSFMSASSAPGMSAEATLTPLSAQPSQIIPTPTIALGIDIPATPTTIIGPSATFDPEKPLAGHKIGIDPGHGPRGDLGAVYVDDKTGKTILTEAEFNLDIALRCRDILLARGADVVVTRVENDTFIVPWPNDANGDGTEGASVDELQTRVDILNDFGAEIFLGIHANSAAEPGNGDDLQVLYCGADDCAFAAENKRLAKIVLAHLDNTLTHAGINLDGGSTMDDLMIDDTGLHLFLLGPAKPPRHPRAITMPGVLGETLYITLPSGAKLLMRDGVRQEIATAYADALQEYLMK
ncbi:MAG: N-acetylmuramoyl-L-alanine amidase [Chloroflexia bacterium]